MNISIVTLVNIEFSHLDVVVEIIVFRQKLFLFSVDNFFSKKNPFSIRRLFPSLQTAHDAQI